MAKTIRAIADAKRAQWKPVYGDEWPAQTYFPNTELSDGEQVRFDGLTITAFELGEGESHADSLLLAEPEADDPVAFIGDVAFNGTHPYTADGHTASWLSTLDRLSRDLSGTRLLPGHGAPADTGLLADQRRYLMAYREVVRRLGAGAGQLSDDGRAELEETMQRFLPDARLTWMIGLGADAVATELAATAS